MTKGSVEWRIIWIILVIVAAIIVVVLSLTIYFESIHQQSPFSFFTYLFGNL
jgi:uncharacterized membrane protein